MGAEGLRRSTRARKSVKSYAVEQVEATEHVSPAPPAARKRKVQSNDDDDDHDAGEKDSDYGNPADDPNPVPAKKAKKKSKQQVSDQDEGTAGNDWTKKGMNLYVVDPKTIPIDSSWHADAAERRIAGSQRKISKLAPGQEETRLRPYVETAPKSYHDSLKRANSQRMFVLDRERGVESNCHANHDDCPRETIKLAGSTGSVYTVTITHTPTCTCPAGIFKRKGEETLCKHALYILHNVLKAPDHLMQQNAFLTSELKEIFANAPAFATDTAEEGKDSDGRKLIEGDCPICFMEFEEGEDIVWCRAACGNNIHKGCFEQWARTKMGRVTCPFCRASWEDESQKTQKVNVAAVEMPEERSKGGYRNVRDQLDYDD